MPSLFGIFFCGGGTIYEFGCLCNTHHGADSTDYMVTVAMHIQLNGLMSDKLTPVGFARNSCENIYNLTAPDPQVALPLI